ncbi:hypothetical protein QM857_02720 [Streptococcus infantis]|mgnify:CR=1 FL=1|jgi:hypothetical protein|uniref:Uncharacterized protein n=1 Tax=Streptococcus infantis SK1076 TaxID=1005705 RepID=F5VZW9_9STRE|nr:hypothetical protein [Streptococcus infantis]EGL87386.1 hypothetical protein HMPREF9967_1670 [Streptococcus infantis SK1076]
MTWYVLTLICLLVVTNGMFVYQLFKLVELDASIRGMRHPKFWGLLTAGGQRGEGLLLYLLTRNKAIYSMEIEEQEELENRKKRLLYLLILNIIFAIFLFSSFIVNI